MLLPKGEKILKLPIYATIRYDNSTDELIVVIRTMQFDKRIKVKDEIAYYSRNDGHGTMDHHHYRTETKPVNIQSFEAMELRNEYEGITFEIDGPSIEWKTRLRANRQKIKPRG